MAENLKTFKIAATASAYQERLNELDQAISKVKKNITYLDTLNIIDAVMDKKNFAAQINALTPNSSLVINTEPFNEGGVNYSRGDIILKDASDIIHHIPGQSGGLYYPKKITTEDNVNYNIEYSFINAIPTQSSASATIPSTANQDGMFVAEVDPAAQSITFNGLSGGKASDSFIYGYCGPLSSHIISCNTVSGVDPVIEFYFMETNTPKERVEVEYSHEVVDGFISLTLPSTMLLSHLYVKVK